VVATGAEADPELKRDARSLWQETDELHRIFGKSFGTVSKTKSD